MEISELIKNQFLDSCSSNMHDQLDILKEFIKLEDQSLKRLEKGQK